MFRPLRLTASLLLALSLPVAAGDKMFTLSPAQRAALKVSVAPLSAHAGAVTVGLPARVVIPPAQERLVTAPVAGVITELRAAAGDPVRVGQTLAVLRGESLIGAQRELAQAAVQVQLAREGVKRDEALFQEGIIPESRLQAVRAQLALNESALAERRAWLRLMGLSDAAVKAAERGERLADSVALVAPMDGVVMEVPAVVGARVETTAPLLRLAGLRWWCLGWRMSWCTCVHAFACNIAYAPKKLFVSVRFCRFCVLLHGKDQQDQWLSKPVLRCCGRGCSGLLLLRY